MEALLFRLNKADLKNALTEILQIYPDALKIVQKFAPGAPAPVAESIIPLNNTLVPPKHRSFDMGKYRQRKIALQVQYEGGNYFGFAAQAQGECEETIEKHIFAALKKICLIEDRQTSGYSRCGRTDRGVSALGQVIALNLRSAFPKSIPASEIPVYPNDKIEIMIDNEASELSSRKRKLPSSESDKAALTKSVVELDYCTLLNRALPRDIRVLGWTEVSENFSARFSATYRTYRYFFIRRHLDIDAMNAAAAHTLGAHDFRNLSKLDVANVTNFVREIMFARIVPFLINEQHPELSVYMLEIKGIAFLWHMVRSIMAVLLLVGGRRESPDVVARLLDVEEVSSKPQYDMAEELPLVLHECGFENLAVEYQPSVLWALTAHYEAMWEEHMIAAARARNSLEFLLGRQLRSKDVKEFVEAKGVASVQMEASRMSWGAVLEALAAEGLHPTDPPKGAYIPLLQRKRGDDYETRKANLTGGKKERLERHLDMKDSGDGGKDQFFARMREQGSIHK